MLTYPADTPLSVSELADTARAIRRNALLMGEVQGQGYIAQALGIADVLAVAYFHALRYRPVPALYCHSEYLGRKVSDARFPGWEQLDTAALVGDTHYPKPRA